MSLKTCSCLELLGQVGINTWLLSSYISFWVFDCTAFTISCTLKKKYKKCIAFTICGFF